MPIALVLPNTRGRTQRACAPGWLITASGCVRASWVAGGLVLSAGPLFGQLESQNSMAGNAALEARQLQPESQPYTVKAGDFRLLITPSLELAWNDNITLVKQGGLQDFILRPMVELAGSYPLNQRNLLRFDIGVGYDIYLEHGDFSALRLISGSELAFDTYIKDFKLNTHDRFQYTQDPAEQASVATTGRYGGLLNTAGVSGTWDLQDFVPGLGYDHENFIASSSEFDYLNRASEIFLARAEFRLHPRLTAGMEGKGASTAYEKAVLNNDWSYSGGLFADWRPGAFLKVEAHGGYVAYLIEQTSRTIKAANQDAFYAALTVRHDITESISYSLSVGHELRLGTEADLIEDTYVRPTVDFKIMKRLALSLYLSYEHGNQGQTAATAGLVETYDWLGTGLSLSHPITKNLSLALKYRLTLRSADIASREYTQNLVGVSATYVFE